MKPPAPAQGVTKPGDDLTFGRHADQVLIPHQLGNGGNHFGCEAPFKARQHRRGGRFGEQKIAEIADGEVADGGKRGPVVAVDDQARDLVLLVGR